MQKLPLLTVWFLLALLGEAARANCLAPLSWGQPAAEIWRGQTSVYVEHSCSGWSNSPKTVRDLRLVGTQSPGVAHLVLADPPVQGGREIVVKIGDKLSPTSTVVAIDEGIVLVDVAGQLAAITDGGKPNWRMVWHSQFDVPAGAGGGATGGKTQKYTSVAAPLSKREEMEQRKAKYLVERARRDKAKAQKGTPTPPK